MKDRSKAYSRDSTELPKTVINRQNIIKSDVGQILEETKKNMPKRSQYRSNEQATKTQQALKSGSYVL